MIFIYNERVFENKLKLKYSKLVAVLKTYRRQDESLEAEESVRIMSAQSNNLQDTHDISQVERLVIKDEEDKIQCPSPASPI